MLRMKFLKTSGELNAALKLCMQSFDQYWWAVAWATHHAPEFKFLIDNKNKIKKIVVGTHFYQTSPEFIEPFINSNAVRFVTAGKGVFHPKVYLFQNQNKKWCVIIGSPNYTKAAFGNNVELAVMYSSEDALIDISELTGR